LAGEGNNDGRKTKEKKGGGEDYLGKKTLCGERSPRGPGDRRRPEHFGTEEPGGEKISGRRSSIKAQHIWGE